MAASVAPIRIPDYRLIASSVAEVTISNNSAELSTELKGLLSAGRSPKLMPKARAALTAAPLASTWES